MTETERFWTKVEKTQSCWLWTGAKAEGYGQFALDGGKKRVKAHRYAYKQLIGIIPEGLQPDHLCRNRGCVNPQHLELVTQRMNILRGVGATAINAAKTHCCRGHCLSGENLYVKPSGERRCMACDKIRRDVHREKVKRNQGALL